jgi:predicted component of type VI protein secretion system
MAGIRLDIGPLSWEKFYRFLPKKEHDQQSLYNRLKDLCKLYVGLDFSISVKLILDPLEVKPVVLQSQAAGDQYYLGYNTWLKGKSNITEDLWTKFSL